MMKLAVLDAHLAPDSFLQCFEEMCRQAFVEGSILECRTTDDIIREAKDYDVLLCCFAHMDSHVLRHLPKLKMVVRIGIGVDNLNLPDFTEHGVLVSNTPDYGVEEVAIHTLMFVLALERNLVPYARSTRKGNWKQGIGREMRRVSSRTLGIIGFGRIARKFAALASPLGYELVGVDPYLSHEEFLNEGVEKIDLDEAFKRSHIIVVLAPATEETHQLVNAHRLAMANDGLLLVNASRGSLVSTDAVLNALESGKLHGVALDVLEEEPPDSRCRALLEHDAVIATPHVAYRSSESLMALNRMSVQTALDYICENKIKNLVNKEVLSS